MMERRPFGSTKRDVTVVGQGTWNIEESDRRSVIAALQVGIDLGMTHLDTAEMYGAGAAEEIVGRAIAGRRKDVFLVSKVLPQNATRKGTVAACEKSLARLKTDYLDCFLLHWRGRHPLEGTFEAFNQLQNEGKIRSWGVSNFDVPDLEEAIGIAGEGRIACNQVLYHLKERAIEHQVLPWCEQNDISLVAYSPFGQSKFPGPHTAGGRVLQEIADAHHATPRQAALRFLLRRPAVFTIPKASTELHVRENAGAAGLQLAEKEIANIDKAFPLGSLPRSLPVL